jgi:poly(hydroxyalkanoate) depolymerase family esterase
MTHVPGVHTWIMLSWLRESLARLFRRGPPRPGHFVHRQKFAWSGRLQVAPFAWPSREYLLYIPANYGGWTRRPLVVLLHGCRQRPEDFAAATRIAALADKHGWLVLLPRQSEKANAWSCWNWFDGATAAGRGETAIVAAQVRAVRRRYRVHKRRIFVAGMSAGGSLAAALGMRHPEMFAGVFVHSGLPCGAASNPTAAMTVTARGPDTDTTQIGIRARADAPGGSARLPLLVIHGEKDTTVANVNAAQLVRQFLALNGLAVPREPAGERPPPSSETNVALANGRSMKVAEYRDGRRVVARLLQVPQLGHAWSGGDPAYPHNDPDPPDATELLGEFVAGRLRP